MTDDIPHSEDDEQQTRLSKVSRRTYLQSIAVAPAPLALPETGEDTASTEKPLVTETALPDSFTPIETNRPTPFASRLINRDGRFAAHQFSVRGFAEITDDVGPRYVVNTASVDLHDPSDASAVRTLISEMFDEYMDRLYCRAGVEWTQVDLSGYDEADAHRHAAIHFDAPATADIEWLYPSSSTQCGEHWVLDTTDRRAIFTVVFGSRQGPWSPRTLLDRARTDVLRRTDR
ncbi:hypothetical protein [Haloplanus rubicundus]|uniref:hypothetical protein n=1 Tax=Haloplanus rubicundus TaxID=1547898 RepID=UPI00130042DF|nr:hypothetical protein [Haloplanus rubicundus]